MCVYIYIYMRENFFFDQKIEFMKTSKHTIICLHINLCEQEKKSCIKIFILLKCLTNE